MIPMITISSSAATVLAAAILGLVTVVTALIAQRQNRKGAAATAILTQNANELDKRKVDLEYFKEYRDQMDKRLELLEKDVKEEREARVKADERADSAERAALDAERRSIRLERRVAQLEDILREHHIVVPPYEDYPTDESLQTDG